MPHHMKEARIVRASPEDLILFGVNHAASNECQPHRNSHGDDRCKDAPNSVGEHLLMESSCHHEKHTNQNAYDTPGLLRSLFGNATDDFCQSNHKKMQYIQHYDENPFNIVALFHYVCPPPDKNFFHTLIIPYFLQKHKF